MAYIKFLPLDPKFCWAGLENGLALPVLERVEEEGTELLVDAGDVVRCLTLGEVVEEGFFCEVDAKTEAYEGLFLCSIFVLVPEGIDAETKIE